MNPSIPSCLLLACGNTFGFCCLTLRSTALLSLFVAVAFWKAPLDFPHGWAHCQCAEFRWPFPNVMAWILPFCLITLTGCSHGKHQKETSFSFFIFYYYFHSLRGKQVRSKLPGFWWIFFIRLKRVSVLPGLGGVYLEEHEWILKYAEFFSTYEENHSFATPFSIC